MFKPESFGYVCGFQKDKAQQAANITNEIVKLWPIVYGKGEGAGLSSLWSMNKQDGDTYTARLAFIEEIKQVSCDHKPDIKLLTEVGNMQFYFVCKVCKKELEPTWSEKK